MVESDLYVVQTPAWDVSSQGAPLTAMNFSVDGAIISFSNKPASIEVRSSYDGIPKRHFEQPKSQASVSSICYHPTEDNLLLYATKDGFIINNNLIKGESILMTRHLGSNLLSMATDNFGESFAIGCADGSIRIYNYDDLHRTKALIKNTGRSQPTQSNQIFSLIYSADNSNIVISAVGSDKVLLWDLRSGNPERQISGPHIRGDAIDYYDGQIITGSCREKKAIELWDFGTCKKIKDFRSELQHVTCCKLSKNGVTVVAGLGSLNQVVAFGFDENNLFGYSKQYNAPITTVAVSPFGTSFAMGTENGETSCYMIRAKG